MGIEWNKFLRFISFCKIFGIHTHPLLIFREVAILCNHQRSVPKQHDVSMGKLQRQLCWVGEDIEELRAYIKWVKKQSARPFEWSGASARTDDESPRVSVVRSNMKEEAASRRIFQLEWAIFKCFLIHSVVSAVIQRALDWLYCTLSDTVVHLIPPFVDKRKPPWVCAFESKMRTKLWPITRPNNTIWTHGMNCNFIQSSFLSLARITVTFCKKYDLPIEKFFNASLLKKFPWAMYAHIDFVWWNEHV